MKPSENPSWRIVLACAAALLCSACGGGQDGQPNVTLLRATPSVSCERSVATPDALKALLATLTAAGATVVSGTCGNASTVLPAMCGVWAGELWVVSVSAESVGIAQSLGFVDTARFPSYVTQPCT